MILALIYILIFGFFTTKFSFFRDNVFTKKYIFLVLVIKAIACLAYYWVYFYYYPGNFQSDSSSTMHDAGVMYTALPNHIGDFFRMIFGLHTELDSDPLYEPYFKGIDKWGRSDATTEFFLNDNRLPIRINALIMIFSFGSYAVHAVFMLIISFIGQFAFYKTFKPYFKHKELLLICIIFITPSILFWTSGVLKEPISTFLLGLFLYAFFKLFINKQFKVKYITLLIFSITFFLGLKPYILLLILMPLILFHIVNRYDVRRILAFYAISLIVIYGTCIVVLKSAFDKDVIKTIVIRQNDFVSLSKGGIFFLNDTTYLRIEYKDINKYKLVDSVNNLYRLQPHIKVMHWKIPHLRDTIFVNNNQDTTLYKLLSVNSPAGSGIVMNRLEYSFSSFSKLIPQSFFNVLCKPFFYDVRSPMELLSSLENLAIVLFFVFCFLFRQKNIQHYNVLWLCVSVVILSFLLIGLTTTVMGAIVRYKIPFLPFLLMIPLLYLDINKIKTKSIISRFFKQKII